MKLYEIADQYRAIEAALIEAGGELTPEIEAALDQLEDDLEAKVDGVCCVMAELDAAATAVKQEVDRLGALAKSRANAAKRLKDYLQAQMERMGRDKVETPRFVAALATNGRPSIRWTGEVEALPDDLKRVTVGLDGTEAYRRWKDGGLPDGFEVVQGRHLRIR